jgi:hypothetical protein
VRERQKTLEEALQETSQFSDKLNGMLNALTNAFEQVKSAEPISAHLDGVVRLGKLIKDRAPKTDESTLNLMMSDLKAKGQSVCNKSVDRQRKLEEGLLFSGQFEDAIEVGFFNL